MSERKSGLNLEGYPNYIAPYNIKKLSERHHPLGALPVYPKKGDPEVWFEETMASERYKHIVDEWARTNETTKENLIPPGMVFNMNLGSLFSKMLHIERPNLPRLVVIAERLVREYYHLDKTEVIFDLEIIVNDSVSDKFEKKNGTEDAEVDVNDPDFSPDFRDELIKRRLANAMMQGACLKGHYMYHMASEELNNMMPDVTDIYSKAMILNDLNYYYIDDVIACQMIESDSEAGMNEVDYSGEVPVIRAKALSFTLLMHEMVLGVVEMLSSHGLPKDEFVAQEVIDLCDTVLNEFWDIRLGPQIWEKFYGLIDYEDHEYLKHVIVGISKLEASEYLYFMRLMLADHSNAKKMVDDIIKVKKGEIVEYYLSKDADMDEDELPEVDWGSLGF